MPLAGYDAAETLIVDQFNLDWDGTYPDYPIVWENLIKDINDPDDAGDTDVEDPPFLRFEIQFSRGFHAAIGTPHLMRKTGFVIIEILTPLGSGSGLAMVIADFIESKLEARNIGGLQLGSSDVLKVGPEGGTYKVTVIVSFYFDLLRS